MNHKIYIILLIFFAFTSCRKDDPTPTPPPNIEGEKEFLIGQWDWHYSDHDYGWCDNQSYFETLTPQSTSDNYKVLFNKYGIVQMYKNDSLEVENKVFFDHFEITSPENYYFIIHLNGYSNHPFSGRGNIDTMQFTYFPFKEEPGCGYYINYFKKK